MTYEHPIYTPAFGCRAVAACPAERRDARLRRRLPRVGIPRGRLPCRPGGRRIARCDVVRADLVPCLYEGVVTHARRAPVTNPFRYRVSYWLVDLDRRSRNRGSAGPADACDRDDHIDMRACWRAQGIRARVC